MKSKRLFSLLALGLVLLLPSRSLSAQMLADSLVQLVAYWNVGDKYPYWEEHTKIQIAGTDTTVLEKSAELKTLEVLAADENSYRLRMSRTDYQHSDYLRMKTMESINKLIGPIEFETSEMGELKWVLPIDWGRISDAMVQACVDEVLQKVDAPKPDRGTVMTLLHSLLSPATIKTAVTTELTDMFQFHGRQYKIGEKYPLQDEVPSLIPSLDQSIGISGSMWVDVVVDEEDEYPDQEVLDVHVFQKADSESLTRMVIDSMRAMGLDVDSEEAQRELRGVSYQLRDAMIYRFHLETGWPLYHIHARNMYLIRDGEVVKQNRILDEWEILLEEEEE